MFAIFDEGIADVMMEVYGRLGVNAWIQGGIEVVFCPAVLKGRDQLACGFLQS
jgi:hypothetical protein